jgi:hypothetical protein
VLANSLLAGGRAFLAEPAKARTPKAFARGVAAGVLLFSPLCIGCLAGGLCERLQELQCKWPASCWSCMVLTAALWALCAGTASLFRNGAFGALVAFGQLTGGLGKGLAVLSMVTRRPRVLILQSLQYYTCSLLHCCTC